MQSQKSFELIKKIRDLQNEVERAETLPNFIVEAVMQGLNEAEVVLEQYHKYMRDR